MSDSEDKILSARYRAAPKAKSPAELDARILQAARDNPPAPVTRRTVPWVPALASAGLAGLAVYIATPLLNPDEIARPPATQYQPATNSVQQPESLDTEMAEPAMEESFAAPAAVPEDSSETSAAREISPKGQSVEADTAFNARSVAKEKRKAHLADDAGLMRSTATATTPSLAPAEEEKSQQSVGIAASRARLSATEIDRRLREITNLANNELLDEAQRLLEALIERCPDCELPTTVAELPSSVVTPEQSQQ